MRFYGGKAERDLVLGNPKQCSNNRAQTAQVLGNAAIDVRQEIEAICPLWRASNASTKRRISRGSGSARRGLA